jgi:hypothetical protein
MLGTILTIALLGYYVNSCVTNKILSAKCKL